MRFDVNSSGSTPTKVTDKSAGVGRAAAIYAKKQALTGPGLAGAAKDTAEQRPVVSPMGQLLRDLHGLKSNDPHAFSKVTASIATRLQEIAETEPDEVADRLHRLADRFSQAAASGTLLALRPSDQTSARGLYGAAAYAHAAHEERAEIRETARSVIGQVLSQYVSELPPPMPQEPVSNTPSEAAPPSKVLVSA